MAFFEICEASSNLSLNLVRNMLDYVQIQTGWFALKYEPIDLSELIKEVSRLVSV